MINRPSGVNLVYTAEPTFQNPQDEINLYDIYLVLAKRRQNILAAILICLALSSVYMLAKQPRYTVSSVIQIGSLDKDDKGNSVLIEMSHNVMEKVKSAYVPYVLSEFRKKNPGKNVFYEIDASIPKDSNIISLKINCKKEDESMCKGLINGVVEKIIADHSVVAGLSRKNLEVKLASAGNGLKSSREEVKFIEAKKERLQQTSVLLTNQLKEKKVLLESALKNRSKITSNNAMGAMLTLQLDNEIKRNQELIDTLEHRLTIGLNQEHDDLEKAEKANARLQNDQENMIGQIQNQLLSINNTKAVVPTLMSDNPSGSSATLIFGLVLLAGLLIGVVFAFFSEFLEKAKQIEVNKKVKA